MQIKDIQTRINDATRAQAEHEFREGIHQVNKFLEKFYKTPLKQLHSHEANPLREQYRSEICSCLTVSNGGTFSISSGLKVPEEYVTMKQNEASEEFIAKIEELQADVENLYSSIENR